MKEILEQIENEYFKWQNFKPSQIQKIEQAGSDRLYFLIDGSFKCVATFSTNIKENYTFFYFAKHFKNIEISVPKVFYVSANNQIYFQEFVGNKSLLNVLEEEGQTEHVFELLKSSLKQLAKMQILGHNSLNYDQCISSKEFGKQAILSDLNYFKYYFLDTLSFAYNKQKLQEEFEILSEQMNDSNFKYFMFRDFQSRNIMVQNNIVSFIDFQGGMKGALQYDVASLLWQAKAQLSHQWKDELLDFYINEVESLLQNSIDKTQFKNQYFGYVLIRLLQVLGAYGFRGLFERKAHFTASIPFALNNLKSFLSNYKLVSYSPELTKVLQYIISESVIEKFTTKQANEQTKLVVEINSFSYKVGLPKDNSDNGGGFVFDMRGILNPGRYEEYKTLSGLDKPVQTFLENETLMNKFLFSAWDIIEININDYLSRNFENLQINFGCTGGQHRSVYAAEQTAQYLRNKFKLKVTINHTNKSNWKK